MSAIRSIALLWTVFVVLAGLTGCTEPAEPKIDITLVRDGKPAAVIVTAKDADKAARMAALELQHHVGLITGAQLPVVTDEEPTEGTRILVGSSKATEALGFDPSLFGPQQYAVLFLADGIVLMGRDKTDKGNLTYGADNANAHRTWPGFYDDQGTLYATYDFLRDHCGVRWLNPTDLGTTYPRTKSLTVSGNKTMRKPFMDYRGGSATHPLSERLHQGGGWWRPNTPEGKAYDKLAFGSEDQNLIRNKCRLFMMRMKAGGEKSPCNHSFYNFYERFWTKGHKNFEAHRPEYFAQGYGGQQPPQLCYSNPATVKQVVADVRDYFDNGGHQKRMHSIASPGYTWGKNFYALEPMDNSAFCKCDVCTPQYEPDKPRHSQHSEYWFTFVNKVAREIKQSHPDKRLTTLAYMSHEGIPSFQLEDNVSVFFCISHNRTPYNVDALKRQIDLTRAWKREQEVPMYLWLYQTFPLEIANNGKFHAFPGFFAQELKRQFDIYEDLDIRGIFQCGMNGEVSNWLSYRLMDDPSLGVDTLLDEYFAQYGAAAGHLRAFHDTVEARYCDPRNYPITESGKRYTGHQNVAIAWKHLGDAATMAKLDELMKKARAAATTDIEKKRVELWDRAVWQYMKAGRASYVQRMEAPMPKVTAPRVAAAGGDVTKVDWAKAASLGQKWYKRGGDEPSNFAMTGRVCHDGQWVYLELVDPVGKDRLEASPQIAAFDDWEVFIAGQQALPYRQYMVGPTGLNQALSHGEVNWRRNVKALEYTEKFFGGKVTSDADDTRWLTRIAIPMKSLIERPLKPGDSFFMNVIRVRNPKLAGEPRYGIDTWVSHTTVHNVDRLGEVVLEK